MKLPNPEQTFIDDTKLIGYSLNPDHEQGKHKARVFKSALNLTVDNFDELKDALLNAVKLYDAIPSKANAYGQKYIIDFPLTREIQTAIIRSVWIVRNDENFPRLVSCYIL